MIQTKIQIPNKNHKERLISEKDESQIDLTHIIQIAYRVTSWRDFFTQPS